MIGREFNFHDGERGAALAIRVIIGGKDNNIDRVLKDGTVIISIKDIPSDLNFEVIAYLSNQLGIEPARFDVISGEDKHEMLVSVLDINPGDLQNLVLSKIS